MLPLITKEGEPGWWLWRAEQQQQPHRSDAATLLLKTELSPPRHCVASATSSSHSATCSGGHWCVMPSINTKQRLVNKPAKLSPWLGCFAYVGFSKDESHTLHVAHKR